jgi:hypothetical protein
MPSATTTTDPLSYYEVLSTFWAAACTACGTDLRGQALVNLEVLGPVLDSFVAELGSKLRPAGIEHGLGQAGSGKPTGTLCDGERLLVLAVEPWGLDLLARGEHRQGLQPEVDTDLARPVLPVFQDLNLQIQVPPTAGILRKAATADVPLDRTAEPEPVAASEEHHAVAINANRARCLEGDPAQGFSSAPSKQITEQFVLTLSSGVSAIETSDDAA